MLRAENRQPTSVEKSTAEGVLTDPPPYFFLERYADAYRAELSAFIEAVGGGQALSPGEEDGRAAQALAEAALASLQSGKPVRVQGNG